MYYEDEGGDEAGPSTSGGQGSSRQDRVERTVQRVAPEEIVDALTIRLAEKIKAELQLEDRAELGKVKAKVNREKANVNKLVAYIKGAIPDSHPLVAKGWRALPPGVTTLPKEVAAPSECT